MKYGTFSKAFDPVPHSDEGNIDFSNRSLDF